MDNKRYQLTEDENDLSSRYSKQIKTYEETGKEPLAITIVCWVFTGLTWIFIILSSIFKQYPFYICLTVIYIVYFILEINSSTYLFLCKYKDISKIHKKLGEYFSARPIIMFKCKTYHKSGSENLNSNSNLNANNDNNNNNNVLINANNHNENNSSSQVDAVLNNDDNKVISSFDQVELPIYSAKDVSGLFLIDFENNDVKSIKDNKKNIIRLHLDLEINFADAISYYDYIKAKEEFWKNNRFKDYYMDYKEVRTIEDFQSFNFVHVGDYTTMWSSSVAFLFIIVLTFGEFFKLYLSWMSVTKHFKIRKLISTRNNLLDEENSKKYQNISPALKIYSAKYIYKNKSSGFISKSSNIQGISKDELNNAKQYEGNLIDYKYRNVGETIGIVEDIEGGNLDYNIPPPSFKDLQGNVPINSDQIIINPVDKSMANNQLETDHLKEEDIKDDFNIGNRLNKNNRDGSEKSFSSRSSKK